MKIPPRYREAIVFAAAALGLALVIQCAAEWFGAFAEMGQ